MWGPASPIIRTSLNLPSDVDREHSSASPEPEHGDDPTHAARQSPAEKSRQRYMVAFYGLFVALGGLLFFVLSHAPAPKATDKPRATPARSTARYTPQPAAKLASVRMTFDTIIEMSCSDDEFTSCDLPEQLTERWNDMRFAVFADRIEMPLGGNKAVCPAGDYEPIIDSDSAKAAGACRSYIRADDIHVYFGYSDSREIHHFNLAQTECWSVHRRNVSGARRQDLVLGKCVRG